MSGLLRIIALSAVVVGCGLSIIACGALTQNEPQPSYENNNHDIASSTATNSRVVQGTRQLKQITAPAEPSHSSHSARSEGGRS